ncbi:HIT-like domain-containing protein [Zopfochytrium polystomum]|nr:HIT-like domain-containing protein [Zopfochytrium polystomum]
MASAEQHTHAVDASCIFCKIVAGAIPSHKIYETEHSFAFLDINPLSTGHALVIPKHHAEFMHQVPDADLADLLPVAKKVALALAPGAYNVLQNNGKLAHQEVPHVHFHVIPKTSGADGLGVGWPSRPTDHAAFAALAAELRTRIGA